MTTHLDDDDVGELALDSAALEKKLGAPLVLLPWRGAPEVYSAPPPKTVLPGALLSQLRVVLPKVEGKVRELPGTRSEASSVAMQKVFSWSSLDAIDADFGATAIALFRHAGLGLETLVRTFAGAKSLSVAFDAVVDACDRGLLIDDTQWPHRLIDGVSPFSRLSAKEAFERNMAALHDGRLALYALRKLVARADDDVYAALIEHDRAHMKNASLGAAIAIAVVLSEEAELVIDAARRVLEHEAELVEASSGAVTLLLSSLRDPALARALVERGAIDLAGDDPESPVWTFLARIGLRAGSVLAAAPREGRERAMGLYEVIRTPASFRALLPLASSKAHGTKLQRLFASHPEITARAVAPILAKPKHPDFAAAKVLGARAGAHAAPAFEEPAAASVDLPELLVRPPWTKPKSRAKVEPLTLEMERVPLTLDATEGDSAVLAEFAAWGDEPDAAEKTREEWKHEIADDHRYDRAVDLKLMFRGPEDLALEEWNGASDKRRLYYPNPWYGGAFAAALLQRGPKFIPGLIKLLRLKPSGADRMPIEVLAPVLLAHDGSELAELFIDELDSGKKFHAVAERWAKRRPATLAKTAIPIALGASKSADAARRLIRFLVSRGHAEIVQSIAKTYEARSGQPVAHALDTVVGTDPLDDFPAKLPKLPGFFTPAALSPLRTKDGAVLPPQVIENVGTMLAISMPEAPYAGLACLRELCSPDSLRDFSWSVFEAWMAVSAPPKEIWALHQLGHLGDDEIARRITPMIRAWPGEKMAARAVAGLAVLANIGTDMALMLLYGIAEKVRFASIQDAARSRIAEIAEKRGLTADELGDRLVPDLGLDARGETELDFGKRKFRVGFDEHLVPFVMEGDARLAALPKPGKGDDAEKVKEAMQRMKALKKDVAAISKMRILRLESAMIAGARWDAATFRALFLDKPLVLQLARRLLWGVYDGMSDEPTTCFRVDVDRTLSDADDVSFALPETARVGVVHPIALSKDELARWQQRFAEYELLQPFAQLTREVLGRSDLAVFEGRELPAPKLVFGLEKLGWARGSAGDGGSFSLHSKPFAGTRFVAQIEYEGAVAMGYIEANEPLEIARVIFFSGREPAALEQVPPILVSEVARDLSLLE